MTPIEKLRRIADYTALNNVAEAIREVADELERGPWQPIETAPVGRGLFVAIGVTTGNEFTAGRPYTTDPWCVWQTNKGEFTRWPHKWAPTHWMPLPPAPAATEGVE